MAHMRLLVTGFPPFPGRPVNPSQSLVAAIQAGGLILPDVIVSAELLPVEYAAVDKEFVRCLQQFQPDVWLAFGVGRQSVPLQFEARGLNLDDGEVPDNTGEIRRKMPISPDGPEEYRTEIDLRSLQNQFNQQGLPAEISEDAGSYLCNHLVYFALHYLQSSESQCQFLFSHLAAAELGLPMEKLLLSLQIMASWFQNQHTGPEQRASNWA